MNKKSNFAELNPAKKKLRRLLVIQLIILIAISIITLLLSTFKSSYSVALGGAICVIANWFFAQKIFAHQGATQAKKIVSAMYIGEAIKIILTATLFVVVFKWVSVTPVAVFIGFIITQFGIWLAPLVL